MNRAGQRFRNASPEPIRACVHDLRNLFAVVASAKFLLEREIDEQKKALVIDALGRVAVEGQIIADGLLSPDTKISAPVIDAASEMRGLSALLGVLERPGTKIYLSCSDESSWVAMTAREFGAVVVELVTNATKAGASKITIRAAPRGRSYWLVVGDNGHGFDAATSQADSKGLHGTGLLRIDAAVARAGGEMKLKSQPNRGCVIAMTLPLMPRQGTA